VSITQKTILPLRLRFKSRIALKDHSVASWAAEKKFETPTVHHVLRGRLTGSKGGVKTKVIIKAIEKELAA
jgi:hypothetical protein